MNPPTTAPRPPLADYLREWQPAPVRAHDALDPVTAQQLANTLDTGDSLAAGDPLPLLWQWIYFEPWPATADLGIDGHPRAGHFLPPIPDRRRMFAGGRVNVTAPLLLGKDAERRSELVSTASKHGSTGELLFVTVRHSYWQNGQLTMTEEQDLVYRSTTEKASFSRPTAPTVASAARWQSSPHTHPSLLFRFSALTRNAHRIHYDRDYTVGTEGFPDLVVHGPLLAIYLSELVRNNGDGRPARTFDFRFRKPVFVADQIVVQGDPNSDADSASLSIVSGYGTVHASAEATFG